MLTISRQPGCGETSKSRRHFLKLGAFGGMGLSLPALLRARMLSSENTGPRFGCAKRCLLVFLNGGPSQLDMWDMKPDAPAEIRGELNPIATNVSDIRISELLPLVAQQADKFKIVRSVTHPCSVHTTGVYTMLTGTVHSTPNVDQTRITPEDHPHLGSIVAKYRGWKDKMPPFITLPMLFAAPPVEGIWPGQNAGFLGRRFDPFIVHGEKKTAEFTVGSLELSQNLTRQRVVNRQALLKRINRASHAIENTPQVSEWDVFYQQAFSLLGTRQVRRAFELNREPDTVRDRYGRHLFGQGLLLARRLVEAHVPLVTVYWIDPTPAGAGGGEYDSHGRIYHHMKQRLVPPTDRALSALFADLSDRGLLDETLVIVMSEFGRTPRINKDAGRDHWPQVQSILMGGAGITGGSIYGASDRIAAYPVENPVTPPDLAQTLFHLLGIPEDLQLRDPQGQQIRASSGTQIPGLYA